MFIRRKVWLVAMIVGLLCLLNTYGRELGSANATENSGVLLEDGFEIPIGQDVPRGVGQWAHVFGNHRAIVKVESDADAVWVRIPWRLHPSPADKNIVIVDSTLYRQVRNFIPVNINREFGDFVFQPITPNGEYQIYYMIWSKPQIKPDQDWVERNGLDSESLSNGDWQKLPMATVERIEARGEFERFDPMEVIATRAETQQLLESCEDPFLLFPESRVYPIRMFDDLPLRWILSGPKNTFEARALRNEFYVFQIGIYPHPDIVKEKIAITVEASDFLGTESGVISGSNVECFNTGGVDEKGNSFTKELFLSPQRVNPMWFGIQIPRDAQPGKYEGCIVFHPQGYPDFHVDVVLTVDTKIAEDEGMDNPYRLSRLKWLNSTIGINSEVTSPYVPVEVHDNTVSVLGRQMQFGEDGFPKSIKVGETELLTRPVELRIEHAQGMGDMVQNDAVEIVYTAPDKAIWKATSHSDVFDLHVQATMEFDGRTQFDVKLIPKDDISVSNIAMELPLVKDTVPYMVGMGKDGGYRPDSWMWKWDQQKRTWADQGLSLEYFVWLGDVDAGLYCRLISPLEDWKNGTNGSVTISEEYDGEVLFRAMTGKRDLKKGEELTLSFRLLPTPLKPLDPERWNARYAHDYRPLEEITAAGANVVNVHHATTANLWINYPFLNLIELNSYVRAAHSRGIKVKLYYSVLQLTNHAPELWAFRSLGDEIYRMQGTQAHGQRHLDHWLREHLVSDYIPGWITEVPGGGVDASLRTRLDSRLNNFYLEGLSWLLKNVNIDGIYLDEVGYSRDVIQRARRILDSVRPGSMIDLHGNKNWWSCNCPVGYYMEHLPYIDRVWFGEDFNPDSPPEFWLIEMSGIPFGLSGDMLQNPNPWRGMLYGMTTRAFYSGPSPTHIWRLWDKFGIQDAKMLGYWDPLCPVKTDRDDVLATVYAREDKALIAIGSWCERDVEIQLVFDWEALGMDPQKVSLSAPYIPEFQKAADFTPSSKVPISKGKGLLLLVEEVSDAE